MYAIIKTGGKQYRVQSGDLLDVERLLGKAGDELPLQEILAVRTQDHLQVGRPLLKEARVQAKILQQVQGPKLIHFRYQRRKGYHRKVGHRQQLTRLKIGEISLNGAH